MTSLQTTKSLKIACIQMDIILSKKSKNIEHSEPLIKKAISKGANVIILPELFTTGYDLENTQSLAEKIDGKTVQWMIEISKEYNITLMGSIIEKGENMPYNTLVVCTPKGVSKYRKIHLFAPMGEADAFAHGTSLTVVDIMGWKVGLAICYDLRFADMFLQYSKKEVDLIIFSSEWPSIRINHWDTLLEARAIESQVFVVACNRVGSDPSNEFGGHSQIISPTGEIISKGSSNEEIVEGVIDHELVAASRAKFSIINDRKRFEYLN